MSHEDRLEKTIKNVEDLANAVNSLADQKQAQNTTDNSQVLIGFITALVILVGAIFGGVAYMTNALDKAMVRESDRMTAVIREVKDDVKGNLSKNHEQDIKITNLEGRTQRLEIEVLR